jgi:aldehyde:ferredoxin oxidoreductase
VIRGGFAGSVLHVDLSRGETRTDPLAPELAADFLGGLGLTAKLAYDAITPGTDPFSPDNPVVLGVGPLVGTSLPSTSRVFAVSKLPTSGSVGWCGGRGASFGVNLKNAGYDHVVIEGRADHPVHLSIIDDEVELRDAGGLWGLGVEDTCEMLWREYERPLGVISIGQSGENRVRFSMAFIDRISTLGRGGLGAVLGAKNLKAISARGSGGVEVADRRRYRALSKAFLQELRDYPYLKEWQELGMVKSFPLIPREVYEGMKKRRISCVSCPVGCKDLVEIPDGPMEGLEKYSSSVINLYTPVLYGFKDYRESIQCMATIDAYGLDMFEFFGVMGFAKTLAERGIIPRELADPEIALDSLASMEAWVEKISTRQGLGDVLADGFPRLLSEFGEQAADLAPALVKGMHPYAGPGSALAWNRFGTMELGQLLDPRGPHVGSGGSPTYFASRPLDVFPKHFTRMGVPEAAFERILPGLASSSEPEGLKVGRLLRYSHAWFSILGSLGICARAGINRFYSAPLCAELYEAVTGIETDLPGLRERVDRIWTLLRMANLREGSGREDEALPDRWFEDPGFKNYLTGEPLSRGEVEQMIEDYYEEWGWDRSSGVPTDARLEELGLANG